MSSAREGAVSGSFSEHLSFVWFPCHVTAHSAQRPVQSTPLLPMVVALLMGLAFGFALEKGQVYYPHVIREQLLFSRNTMLKMFLSAVAASSVVVAALRAAGIDRVSAEYTTDLARGVPALVIGGMTLGVGMALAGSCPGTAWIQAGANVANWSYVLTGGLVGAEDRTAGRVCVWLSVLTRTRTGSLLYSFLHSRYDLSNTPLYTAGAKRLRTLWISSPSAGLLFAFGLALVVALTDRLSPEPAHAAADVSWLRAIAWHPAVAGVVVGLLQLPAALVINELIGSSQSYVNVVAFLTSPSASCSSWNSYLERYKGPGVSNRWQVVYGGGAVLGSLLSYSLSHGFVVTQRIANPIPLLESFFGGFFLVFGARMAAGCTSGHGISGMGSGSVGSMLAVASMFAGAIGLSVARAVL